MSISKFLFGENRPLLELEKFSQSYKLMLENKFIIGKENSPVLLNTTSEIILDQDKQENFIYNNIELINIIGDTDSHIMKPFLEQILALSDISKNLDIKRNLDGKILSVEKKEILWQDWEMWKKNSLKEFILDEQGQNKFVSNYENGLNDFDTALKKNLQYLLLMPETYSIIFPPNQHYNFLSSPLKFNSRLVESMEYTYQMKLVKLEEEGRFISLELHSTLINKEELIKNHLKKIYKGRKEFSVSDFDFIIKMNYIIEKSSSKINKAELNFCEKLHDNLVYSIVMNLKES